MKQDVVIHRLKECLDRQEPCGMATVVGINGSIPTEVGSKILVSSAGQILAGTVGGGALEAVVIHRLVRAIAEGRSSELEHHLTDDEASTLGMTCGGSIRLFLEPFGVAAELVLVGAGHVNQAVAKLAKDLDYRVTVVDDRPQWATGDYFPHAHKIEVVKSLRQPFDNIPRPEQVYLVVATRCHATDELVMRAAAGKPWKYLGMIGSRLKVEKLVEKLGADGVSFENLHAPIGLDLGGKSPAAVALSIMAELQMVRNQRTGRPLGAPAEVHVPR
jgi:xanthine dehydrogenase accessory factor